MNTLNNFYIWTLNNKWTAQLMRCDFFFLYIKHCPRTRMSMKICRQPQTKNWRGDERSQKYTVLNVSPTNHINTIWRLITALYRHLVPEAEYRRGEINMLLMLRFMPKEMHAGGKKYCHVSQKCGQLSSYECILRRKGQGGK